MLERVATLNKFLVGDEQHSMLELAIISHGESEPASLALTFISKEQSKYSPYKGYKDQDGKVYDKLFWGSYPANDLTLQIYLKYIMMSKEAILNALEKLYIEVRRECE